MTEMTPRQRLLTALRGGTPDRVPCALFMTRWARHVHGCVCPRHQLQVAEEYGLDQLIQYGIYTWQNVSNDYLYAPGGGPTGTAGGLYGDLPEVNVELRVENTPDAAWYYRTFHTPAGTLRDVIQWARPGRGFGDGPNPHRVEPLVKTMADVEALSFLYPPVRRDLIADIPLLLADVGERALVAAFDCTNGGGWGLEPLGPVGMLYASVDEPALLRAVCRLAEDVHQRNLRAMLEAGIEAVIDSWFQYGLSVGWSLETYRMVFLPLIREAVELAHGYGALYIYQDDGRQRDLIPLLVEIGVDVVSGLQPPEVGDVDLQETKRLYGDRVALFGGLDPCYVFDRGTPATVREAVCRAIADAGPGGGYALCTAEAIDPTATPPASIHAAVQAARDFGVYGRDI